MSYALASPITSGFTGYVNNTDYVFGLNTWRFRYNDTTKGANYAVDAPANGAANFVTLELMAVVPEPSSFAMLAFGFIAMIWFRKR
jgi:hypothetical protein